MRRHVGEFFPMLFAGMGIATGAFEVLAAVIGSGLVVGSFTGGLLTIAASRSRRRAEKWALIGGYFGGLVALLGLVLDILEKRFV
jgi:hypothetical protein